MKVLSKYLLFFLLMVHTKVFTQNRFDEKYFSENLTKVIKAKQTNFKSFLQKKSNDVDTTKLIKLLEGGNVELIKHTNTHETDYFIYNNSLVFETAKLSIDSSSFVDCLKKAYLPIDCIILFVPRDPHANINDFYIEVIEKKGGVYNLTKDSYSFTAAFDEDSKKYSCLLSVTINSLKREIKQFNDTFVNQSLQLFVKEKSTAFKAFKKSNKADTVGEFKLKTNFNNWEHSSLTEEYDKEDNIRDTKFKSFFEFIQPSNQPLLTYQNWKQLLSKSIDTSKYALYLKDSLMEGDTIENLSFGILELYEKSYFVTNDKIEIRKGYLGNIDDEFNNVLSDFNLRITLEHSSANKANSNNFFYTAKTTNKSNDSLRAVVQLLYSKLKMHNFEKPATKDEPYKPSKIPYGELLDADCPFITLPQYNVNNIHFCRCFPEGNSIFLIKKLGNDTTKHFADVFDFIEMFGNSLPDNFVFAKRFYEQFFKLKNSKTKLGVLENNKSIWAFTESYYYRNGYETSLNVYVDYRVFEKEDNTKEYYIVGRIIE